jgi:hypothetical protein
MELWVVLAIGAFIFTWCSIFAFLNANCLTHKSPPVGAGVSLVVLFLGWIILTCFYVKFGDESIREWVMSSGAYFVCFLITLHKSERWLRAINDWLPFD